MQKVAAYKLKVTLAGTRPPIWRRLRVRSDITFRDLHEIIQRAMGWEGYHLHAFRLGDLRVGAPEVGGLEDLEDERQIALCEVIPGEGFEFEYEYDFGDGWIHHVLVEEAIAPEALEAPEEGPLYAECLGGRRACPPEDVGGIWGYAEFLKAIRNPKHPEHEERLEWIGGDFDPEAFDPEAVNARLRALGGRRRKRRRAGG